MWKRIIIVENGERNVKWYYNDVGNVCDGVILLQLAIIASDVVTASTVWRRRTVFIGIVEDDNIVVKVLMILLIDGPDNGRYDTWPVMITVTIGRGYCCANVL